MTRLVRAGNPGPMTLEGTNTWLVGRRRVLVVDPGPAMVDHVAALLDEVDRDGGRLGGVLLTHRHPDHAEALGVARLKEALSRLPVPVLSLDPALGRPPTPRRLAEATDEPVRVLPVPGHTDDSLALVVPGRRQVLTGDTVLGRGTSVVAHPDGDLGHYLASLGTLADLVGRAPEDLDGTDGPDGQQSEQQTGQTGAGPWVGLPGHGPVVTDLAAAVGALREHRLQRVEQVRAALLDLDLDPDLGPATQARPVAASGPAEPEEDVVRQVVRAVYPELTDPVLAAAAGRTVRATLVHLRRAGG